MCLIVAGASDGAMIMEQNEMTSVKTYIDNKTKFTLLANKFWIS